MVRAIIGASLALHGVAHGVGFTASWRYASSAETPYTTEILNGAVDVGDLGIRLIGVLWLVAAVAMISAAILVWRRSDQALAAVVAATWFSLAMCLVGLPAAALGAAIDLVILASLIAAAIQERPTREVARYEPLAITGAPPRTSAEEGESR